MSLYLCTTIIHFFIHFFIFFTSNTHYHGLTLETAYANVRVHHVNTDTELVHLCSKTRNIFYRGRILIILHIILLISLHVIIIMFFIYAHICTLHCYYQSVGAACAGIGLSERYAGMISWFIVYNDKIIFNISWQVYH